LASTYESWISLRYLRSRRKEVFISIITIISVVGVAVSVMVLNMVLAVMAGFEGELKSKLIDTSAHVVVRQFGGEMHEWQEVRKEVAKVPEVLSVSPYTYNQAMLSHQGVARGLIVQGIGNDGSQAAKLEKSLIAGEIGALFRPALYSFTRPDGSPDTVELPPILIGKSLAQHDNLQIGTPVTILAPQFTASPQGLLPRLRRFLVVGIYSSGLVEYESGLAYTALPSAQSFFGIGGVSGLEVMVQNLDNAKEVAREIYRRLQPFNGSFEVSDWSARNKPLYDALKLEKQVYFVVLLLLILVASFSIVSTLVMVVMEKSRDIAILKTLGARDASIRKIFLLQGSVIGGVGTLLGTLLGLAGCYGLKRYGWQLDESVFALSSVPVYFNPLNFAVVALASFVITSLAGLYPARRAARLKVADALRFE